MFSFFAKNDLLYVRYSVLTEFEYSIFFGSKCVLNILKISSGILPTR